MRDLPALRNDIERVSDTMTNDEVLEIRARAIFVLGEAKDLIKTLNEALIEWIKVNGDLVLSDTKYATTGKTKTVKCNDVAKTLESLFVKTGGDFDQVTDRLSSNAFKPAACKIILGDEWSEQFVETWADKVVIKDIDTKFCKKSLDSPDKSE